MRSAVVLGLSFVSCAALVGCPAQSPYDPDQSPYDPEAEHLAFDGGGVAEVEVEAASAPLLGVTNTLSCTADEQAFALNTVNYGWFGDPGFLSDSATQESMLLFATRGTAEVTLTCGGAADSNHDVLDYIARTYLDSFAYDKEAGEPMEMSGHWTDLVQLDNGSSSTTASFYQTARQRAAGVIWHEAMHRWGYDHINDFTGGLMSSAPEIAAQASEWRGLRSTATSTTRTTTTTTRRLAASRRMARATATRVAWRHQPAGAHLDRHDSHRRRGRRQQQLGRWLVHRLRGVPRREQQHADALRARPLSASLERAGRTIAVRPARL